MTQFVRNAWYVAAWSTEIDEELRRFTLLDDHVVMFRKSDGTVAALSVLSSMVRPGKPASEFLRVDLIGPASGPTYQIRHTQTMFQQGMSRIPVDTDQSRFKRCGPETVARSAVTDTVIR